MRGAVRRFLLTGRVEQGVAFVRQRRDDRVLAPPRAHRRQVRPFALQRGTHPGVLGGVVAVQVVAELAAAAQRLARHVRLAPPAG
nr:hypothetical protein [Streptomyces sp. 7-21]